MDVQGFLYNTDETETFTVQSSGDRIQRFACTIGEARIDATWGKTQVEVPISVPHTLDATIIGQPLVKIIEHQVFDHDDLVVQELIRRPGRTRIMLERAWTTIGALP